MIDYPSIVLTVFNLVSLSATGYNWHQALLDWQAVKAQRRSPQLRLIAESELKGQSCLLIALACLMVLSIMASVTPIPVPVPPQVFIVTGLRVVVSSLLLCLSVMRRGQRAKLAKMIRHDSEDDVMAFIFHEHGSETESGRDPRAAPQ